MKRSFVCYILLAISLCFAACAGSRHAQQTEPLAAAGPLKKKDRVRLVGFAEKQMGAPYKWGGNTPRGFDCSGFTSYCFGHFGVQLPRTAAEQAKDGKKIRPKKARAGDLIFFEGPERKRKKAIGHVGIVMGGRGNNIKFIHAATNGIIVSYLGDDYFRKRFRTIKRVYK